MSSSLKTENYELPIFEPDDRPSWLGDWNESMETIDTALGAVSDNANDALSEATQAKQESEVAYNNSVNAKREAEEANQKAEGLSGAINDAVSKSEQATLEATNAMVIASGVDGKATEALENSQTAIDKSGQNEDDIRELDSAKAELKLLYFDGTNIRENKGGTILTYNDIYSLISNPIIHVTVNYADGNVLIPTFWVGSAIEFSNTLIIDGSCYDCRLIINSDNQIKYEEIELGKADDVTSAKLLATQANENVLTLSAEVDSNTERITALEAGGGCEYEYALKVKRVQLPYQGNHVLLLGFKLSAGAQFSSVEFNVSINFTSDELTLVKSARLSLSGYNFSLAGSKSFDYEYIHGGDISSITPVGEYRFYGDLLELHNVNISYSITGNYVTNPSGYITVIELE